MIKRGKKAQTILGLSYGAIFSIIIIIMIISVAFYAINQFLDIGKCANVGLFYDDLQKEIDTSWTSGNVETTFVGNLPTGAIGTGVDYVCFGTLIQDADAVDALKKEEFDSEYSFPRDHNIFIYPPDEVCLPHKKLEHTTTDGFFCIKVEKGEVRVKLDYNQLEDTLVRLS